MAIPTPFGLEATGLTLGDNFGTLFASATNTSTETISQPSIFEFLWKAPTSSLGNNFTTEFNSGSITNIQNISVPTIFENIWKSPTSSLGQNLATLFDITPSSTLVTIPSSGTLSSFGFVLPSMVLGGQYSTFIYTKDIPITISAAGEQASVQIWYSS